MPSSKCARTQMLIGVVALVLIIVCQIRVVMAATYLVDIGGAGDFVDISSGITHAAQGDTLIVNPGLYTEYIIVDKELAIFSNAGSTSTEISAPDDADALVNINANNCYIAGFTLKNGRHGIRINGPITNCVVHDCTIIEPLYEHVLLPAPVIASVVSGLTLIPHANLSHNAIVILTSTLTESAMWPTPPTGFAYQILVGNSLTIAGPSSPVLTLQPGTIFKVRRYTNWQDGSTHARINVGTSAGPGGLVADGVIFTSWRDPEGGNTSGDTSAPVAGDWRGVLIGAAAGSVVSSFSNCEFRYGGLDFNGILDIQGGQVTVADCWFTYSSSGGLAVSGPESAVTGCTFASNQRGLDVRGTTWGTGIAGNVFEPQTQYGAYLVANAVAAVVGQNTFAARPSGDYNGFGILTSTLTESAMWPTPPTGFAYQILVGNSLTIAGPSSPVLTLQPGTIFKVRRYTNWQDGSTHARINVGTSAGPGGLVADGVIFTSWRDPEGGNTSGDTSAPVAGDWRGVLIGAAAGSVVSSFSNCEFRYGGLDFNGILDIQGGDIAISSCIFRNSSTAGVSASGLGVNPGIANGSFLYNVRGLRVLNNSRPIIDLCRFVGNSSFGIDAAAYSDGLDDLDARFCWWGSADGPGPVGPGSGDNVSLNVLFEPWLAHDPHGPHEPLALLTPANGSAVTNDDVPFSWTNAGVQYYELYVADNASFTNSIIQPFFFEPFELDQITNTSLVFGMNWLIPGTYYWKIRAVSGGSTTDSEVWSFNYQPPVYPDPLWGPIYRLYNPDDKDHFYCSSEGHQQIAGEQGYREERVEGFFSHRIFSHPDAVPLFRFYDDDRRCHYYTSREARVDSLITGGLRYEGIIGWAWNSPQPGMVPLHHLSAPGLIDNLYTTSESEKEHVQIALGFTYEDITAYVSPAGDSHVVPAHLQAAMAGAGVSIGTGNFQLHQGAGFSIPSIGLPLSFAHVYNSQGVHLLSAIEPLGPGWSHTYNAYIVPAHDQWLVCWPDGSLHRYSQSTGQCLDREFGVYDQMEVLGGGIFEITKKDQIVYRFERPSGVPAAYPSLLISIRDRNQNTITCQYEDSGLRRLVRVTGPAGRELNFVYHDVPLLEQRLVAVADVAGSRTLSFAYEDVHGRLTSFTDCDGAVTEYQYDEDAPQDHQLSRIVLPRGNTIDNTYAERRVTGQSFTGQTLSFARVGSAVTVTDGENQSTQFVCDPLGRVNEIIDTSGGTGSVEITRGDPDNPALPTQMVDRKGNTTTLTYDSRGNALTISRPLGANHAFLYDLKNNVTRHTDPRNKQTNYAYNASGNLTAVTDPTSAVTVYGRRADGLTSHITDPLSRTTTLSYDQHGNLTAIHDPLGNSRTMVYDQVGRLLQSTDEEGFTTAFSHDCAGRLTSSQAPDGGVTAYTYDPNGNLVTVADPIGNQTTWTYNALDLPLSRSNAAGGQVTWGYREDGSLASRNLGNGAANYSYDNSGRLVGISSTAASLTLDDNGNITQLNDAGGTMSFAYDALDRLVSYQDYDGHTVSYGYNAAGNITSITYEPGKTVKYDYDDAGRLNYVRDWLTNTTSYSYNSDGTVSVVFYPNGATKYLTYDGAGRLVGLQHLRSDASVITGYAYTLDRRGSIVAESRQDPLAMPPLPAQYVSYIYGSANRLLSAGATNYSYDGAGNVVSRTGDLPLSFTYDLENRVTAISGSASAQFTYDTFGHRRQAVRGAETTRYVMDVHGMGNVLIEKDGSGSPRYYYVHGLGLISRIDAQGNVRHYHADQVGSVVAMTDAGQTITHAYQYNPFGNLLASQEENGNRFRYVGVYGVMSEAAGLSYMRARYYEAPTGRFISEDPIWDANLYLYALANPIRMIDPDGRKATFGGIMNETYHFGVHVVTLGIFSRDKVDENVRLGVRLGKLAGLTAASIMVPEFGTFALGYQGTLIGGRFSLLAPRGAFDPVEALEDVERLGTALIAEKIHPVMKAFNVPGFSFDNGSFFSVYYFLLSESAKIGPSAQ